MANDRDTNESNNSNEPGAPRDAGSPGASRAEITNAVANAIDAVFGAGFARQIHEQAQARGAAAPALGDDALSNHIGSLSDADKQALLLNQRDLFNLCEDRQMNALLGFGDAPSEEAMKAFFERVKSSASAKRSDDSPSPTNKPAAPRKPSA